MKYKNLSNKELYEQDEVINKYAQNSVRARSLNNAEKELIDRYDIKDKKVLVLGCGAGRLAVNLLLFGNSVHGVDRSEKLISYAKNIYPESRFEGLTFTVADMTNLSFIQNNSFDAVIFAMNSIDYLINNDERAKSINEAERIVKRGGIVSFSSHNKIAYLFSPKISLFNRDIIWPFCPYSYLKENVIGGGTIFKGNPGYIIKSTTENRRLRFIGFVVDSRNRLDRILSRKLFLTELLFPYIIYIFKKID
jgi:ubiquinone/menaquinone biosynthesis C-methylase UbiE